VADPDVLIAHGVRLVPAPSVGPPVDELELRIDAAGITQLGGTPVTAWQIPWRACRDVRTSQLNGVVVVALSFGALRYRWELPGDRIDGGPDAVVSALRRRAGARPMVRGLRGARRRH
jgi:hypothetical protein